MKSILTSVLLIICVGVFGQKVVSRSMPLNTYNYPRIFKTDTLWYNEKYGISIDTSLWYSVPQKDTVDVIALVSDTTMMPLILDKRVWFNWKSPNGETFAIKCKAVREPRILLGGTQISGNVYSITSENNDWEIVEYLLPKKYIVWQSVIINKTK